MQRDADRRLSNATAERRERDEADTYDVGVVGRLIFDDVEAGIGVGRLGVESEGLIGAKFIGINNSVGVFIVVLDDESIEHLIDMLNKLKRSEGHIPTTEGGES